MMNKKREISFILKEFLTIRSKEKQRKKTQELYVKRLRPTACLWQSGTM